MDRRFRVGFTRDFLSDDGTVRLGDIGLHLLDAAPGIDWEFLPDRAPVLTAAHLRGFDALAVLGPSIPSSAFDGPDRLSVIARYGVGYEKIDIDACTRNGVAVTITPDGVRRPMAIAIMTLMLALSGCLLQKDRLARSGGWSRKLDFMGIGLTGRVLGSLGLGNIARELFTLVAPLGMRHVAHDPYASPDSAPGVELVDLDTLFRTADVVAVNCPLTPDTRHLVNAGRLAMMKPTAFLINTARGPIVDQAALVDALRERRIAGAGIDVFEREPVDPHDPILTLDNVIVTPHALGWTDEWIHLTGRSALRGILAVAAGREPDHIVNRDVLRSRAFQEKLARYAARSVACE
jgi:phosphoglycerate dehydrogenase-like enzyme